MPRKTTEEQTDARNRGVEKRAEELREPNEHPPREGVERGGSRDEAPATEQDPAATENLENPPQVKGPRERLNDDAGAKGVE